MDPQQAGYTNAAGPGDRGLVGYASKKMQPMCPSLALLTSLALVPTTPPICNVDSSPSGRAHHRANVASMARVYADVNQNMPRSYWDYDSVNIGRSPKHPCSAHARAY
jgi:hypothetical protein